VPLCSEEMGSFAFEGHELTYSEHFATAADRGRRPIVLLHGLLLSRRMHVPLARDLAARGHHVLTLDLLGHGASEHPADMWRYSMSQFADQVVALLDHLEIPEAVVAGTSLGANVALEAAALHPQRLRGMVVEMPVLDNALMASALVFTPLMAALNFGAPVMRLVGALARAVPERALPFYANIGLDTLRQDPTPSAAVLQGLFFGRIAPPRTVRRTLQTPALVIGHRRDPVHPFSDAGMLVSELPHARLLQASSILELRLSPERLTAEIAAFLNECWRPRARPATARRTPGRQSARNGGVRRARA